MHLVSVTDISPRKTSHGKYLRIRQIITHDIKCGGVLMFKV